MKKILALVSICLPVVLIATPLSSQAHDRHHHHHKREHKEEYWDGQCKIERKWKKNGEYKEKRKCRDRPVVYQQQPVYAEPQPVFVAPRPVIAIPRPEAIVISPQIVIRP